MIKYKTHNYSLDIEETEILSETDKFYYYKCTAFGKKTNRRERKISTYHKYHNTKEAAIEYLINNKKEKVKQARETIDEAERDIIKLLKQKEGLK